MANPFAPGNNNFSSGITPPTFGNTQVQMPQNATTLPSYNPFTSLSVPSGQSSVNMNPNGSDFGNAVGGAATGVGDYLTGLAQNEMQANQQGLYGGNAMMQGINQQEQMANQGSQAALQAAQPSNTVAPYAKLALASALMQSKPSQLNLPSSLQKFTPQIQNGTNWNAINQAGAQYLSPAALQNAFEVQNKQLLNVDPNAQPMRYSSLFPNDPNAAADQQDMTNWQSQAQQRRAGYENTSRQALQTAINNAQNNQPGFWSKLGGALISGIGSAAPFLLG